VQAIKAVAKQPGEPPCYLPQVLCVKHPYLLKKVTVFLKKLFFLFPVKSNFLNLDIS
jgi:hypothetical protein